MTESEVLEQFPTMSKAEQDAHNVEILKKYGYYLEVREGGQIALMPSEQERKARIARTQAILHRKD